MRYGAGQKEKTRLRLLRATAESLRARGVAATTIGGVTAAAGITHGGFYAHFRSRDELVAAGIREMFSPKAAASPPPPRRRMRARPWRPTWTSTSAGPIGTASP